ncbi:hypothetical protein SDC9_66927 [bioreactor metagenome]|uniref:Uncharacterized protein n=1 Tax=bioreactor metagenome TaxID=1076179 RepID=A0A644XX41_9ZZZZ
MADVRAEVPLAPILNECAAEFPEAVNLSKTRLEKVELFDNCTSYFENFVPSGRSVVPQFNVGVNEVRRTEFIGETSAGEDGLFV